MNRQIVDETGVQIFVDDIRCITTTSDHGFPPELQNPKIVHNFVRREVFHAVGIWKSMA